MNEIEIFEFKGRKIRGLCINEEAYFVGKDVATVLGYQNTRDALSKRVDKEDKKDGVAIYDSIGREQKPILINESGLYSLILSSKLPQAKEFKHWVTSEVLPSIRRKGFYSSRFSNEDKEMKEILNSMIELSKSLVEISRSTVAMYKNALDLSDGVKNACYENKDVQSEVTDVFSNFNYQKCKVDTFPEEIRQIIDAALEEMIKRQELNYSEIARMCVTRGYSITSPSIKTYYEKSFLKRK